MACQGMARFRISAFAIMANLFLPCTKHVRLQNPVKGLYLCGSGAHPGGGVMGAPGRNAAAVVLDDLKQGNKARYGAVLHEIMDHNFSFTACNFCHEFRSSNFEAHNLVKHVLRLGVGGHVWLGHPGDLSFVPINFASG